ncbi:uncharacterized protein HGUI_04048 [Hanseniaspora guilliermondii]|uniref:Uncharacterized protein n=1 Tax=Hanseniaspora guilliermondii TaxID=56406 RepID=A0A1L0D3V0_9ASCO|nr:uncharacterized protein HGUI_04048 [Hanseniaspora guilliermondii]
MVYINSRSRVTLSLLLSACVYSNLASAGILDGLYTTTTAYTGTDVQTYSTQYFKNILGLTVSTLYYVETPYSNYSVDIYSNWDQSTTSTYITEEEYYIGTDSIGTHATVYYVVTPQSNDISVISTYGDYLSTTTYSTSYNLVSTTVDLDSVGLSAFGLSSAVTSTSTTYYVATPLSRSTTTFYIASSVYASETVSILGNVVTDGTSPYVLESVYIATPINPLVSSSVDLYVGSTVTTYSTSISTDTAGTQHTLYYISSPYPVSKVTGLNFWGNTYSSISTVSSHITTNSAGSSIEEEYYVLYEPTPDAKSTKFTYWPGSTTSTYSTGYQSTSELIFSIDLFNLLLFWEWFQEKTFTYTTYYVKTPYSSAIANSYSYEASITTPSTYKTQTTTFFGINNQPTVETIYYIATPLASGESISYSNWDGNDAVTISTYTTNGTTVKVVLEPYPTTTIHSVTTDVPSITAVETYKTATETTIIDGATYVATVLDINVPLVTTIYTSVNQSSGVTAMETVGSSTSLAEVTTPANVFNDQLSEIVNTYTFTTYNIVYPLYIDITNSGIAGSNPTTYSTSASYISLNDDTTETIEIYYVATPAPTTFTTDVVSGSSTVEEAVSYYYTTGTDGKSTLTSGVSTIVTGPTTFTTDVVSGSSTAEEAVSYYYTTGTDGKSTLTSGVSTIVTAPTTFTTDVVSGSSTVEEAVS